MKRLLPYLGFAFFLHLLLIVPWFLFFSQDKPLAGGGSGGGGNGEAVVVGFSVVGSSSPSVSGEGPSRTRPPRQAPLGGPSGSAIGDQVGTGSGTGTGAGVGSGSGLEGSNAVLAEILSRIERAKRYPSLARNFNLQGTAFVHFQINAEGKPEDISLKTSSGSKVLDEEALATIRRAAPFPVYEKPLEIGIKFEIAGEAN